MTSSTRLARIDLVAGLVLAVGVAIEALAVMDPHPGVAAALCLVGVAPVAWRRRRPLGVAAWLFGVFVATNLLVASVEPLGLVLGAVAMAVYGTGAYTDGRRAVLGLAVSAVGLGSVQLTFGSTIHPIEVLWLVTIASVIWVLGRVVRTRTRLTEALHETALQAEEAREHAAERAVAEERRRIAREMHDIVAHSVSCMVVQAGGARSILDHDAARAEEAAERIEDIGRAALGEMRRLLGLLTAPDGRLIDGPPPSLAAVGELIDRARGAGLPARLHVAGRPEALPAAVDLAAYRVVQEALTNAIKHAPGAETDVRIRYGADDVELEVADRGSAVSGATLLAGAGHGLIGMRERVRAFGGELHAGHRDGGGFAVRARIPIHDMTEVAA